VTKQSDPSDVSIFAHFGEKYLWIECRLPSLLHKEFRIPEGSQSSVANYTNSNAKNKTPGRCHTDHLSSQDSQPPPQLREHVVNALLDRSIGSGDRAAFATLCDVNAGQKPRRSAAGAPRRLLEFRILADDRHLSVVELRRLFLVLLSHTPEFGGNKRAGRNVRLASAYSG
jgi:hypothetical protein